MTSDWRKCVEAIQIFQKLIGARLAPIVFQYQPYTDTFLTYPYHHSTAPNFEAEFVDIMFDSIVFYALDLENVEFEDLSATNKERKSALKLDVRLLPDEVFAQNRLIERKVQEEILKLLCKRISNFCGIERANILQFINNGYFDAILQIWADVGEIKVTQIQAIKYFSKHYAEHGYLGVLQYRFNMITA